MKKTKTPEYTFSKTEVGIVIKGKLHTLSKSHPNFKEAWKRIDTGKFEGIEKLFPPDAIVE